MYDRESFRDCHDRNLIDLRRLSDRIHLDQIDQRNPNHDGSVCRLRSPWVQISKGRPVPMVSSPSCSVVSDPSTGSSEPLVPCEYGER